QGNGVHEFTRLCLEHRCRLPAPVERIDLLPAGIVQDCIRVFAVVDFRKRFERLEIDDARFGFLTVAREAAIQLRRERYSMDSGSIVYFAGHRRVVQIDDDDLVGVADVQPARSRINREIVPTSFSANPNFLEKSIRTFGPGEMNEARGRKSEQRGYGNAKALC